MVPVLIDQATGAIVRDPKTGFALRQPYETGGEIIVAVPDVSVFAGYYKNPEATMKKFERDVFQKGDLWYRSGDALRRTGDGRWFFLDRLGDTFRWKGENVSTAEVADVLGRFPGVVEANVYGVALPAHDGRAGCAAVYIDPNLRKDFDYAGLLKYVSSYPPFIPLLSLSSKTLRRRRQARTYPPPPLRRPHLPTHRAGNDTDP